ncbi:PAS domain S-box protein, partial [bacterium]
MHSDRYFDSPDACAVPQTLAPGLADAHLAAIVESSDDAIVSKDLNGIVRSWNQGAERLFGYTAAEMVGRPMATIIPKDREVEEDMILARVRRGEKIEHFLTVR